MKKSIFKFINLLLIVLIILPSVAFGSTKKEKMLSAKIDKLHQEMTEMKKEYQAKLDDMNSKMNELMKLVKNKKSSDSNDTDDLASLRAAADSEADKGIAEENSKVTKKPDTSFFAKNLSQQIQNPEISVTGDVVFNAENQKGNRKVFDSTFRSMAIHLSTYLDPDTKFKAAFPIKEKGTGLGEAYITKVGFTPNMTLTLGRFRQQFGVINRWHKHALDQVDFPLALRRIFGDGGLDQNGISMDWHLSSDDRVSQDLQLQLTEANNGRVFGENERGNPSVLLHYKNYRDLDKNTYQELGLTAMAGSNNEWDISKAGAISQKYDTLPTYLLGLDFTHFWEPVDNGKYRNFLWRTELYGMAKDILAGDGSGRDTIRTWGGYTNFQWKLNRKLETGIRYDYFKPDVKKYASLPGYDLAPLAYNGGNAYEWQVSPYVTLYQSPWVHYRLEFNYLSSGHMDSEGDKQIMFQCIWAAGPHKHDRY